MLPPPLSSLLSPCCLNCGYGGEKNKSNGASSPWHIISTPLFMFLCWTNYRRGKQTALIFPGPKPVHPTGARDALCGDTSAVRSLALDTLKPFITVSVSLSAGPLEAHTPSRAGQNSGRASVMSWLAPLLSSSKAPAPARWDPKPTRTQWGLVGVALMFLMSCKWDGKRAGKKKRGAEPREEEAVGVFVCPRRPLSSHYQRIRQMLPLYRRWFDSKPPTLISSSLLSSTTPRQRLLSSLPRSLPI